MVDKAALYEFAKTPTFPIGDNAIPGKRRVTIKLLGSNHGHSTLPSAFDAVISFGFEQKYHRTPNTTNTNLYLTVYSNAFHFAESTSGYHVKRRFQHHQQHATIVQALPATKRWFQEKESHMQDIRAKLVLTPEEITYLWHGGTLVVKIDATETTVSLDLSAAQRSDTRRQSVRIKRVQSESA